MPDTKPDITFNEDGVCNACTNYTDREEIDWSTRWRDLAQILNRYRSADRLNYDCIIPVSGGKDSTFQTIKLLEMGMNPLCVTATTDELSAVGRRNLDNLQQLGVDHIEYSTNPRIRRKLNKYGLTEVGDISWPEHAAIFTIPVRIAVQMKIPLIIWGENPQNEYGGPATSASNNVLTREWLSRFGGLLGVDAVDLLAIDGVSEQHIIPYTYPSDHDLAKHGVTGLFLGYYLPWDGWTNSLIAQAHGFETLPTIVEGSIVTYENLDNVQTGIHDYFKYLKYGFGRATDLASMQVRRGRLTREEAVNLVRMHDGRFPATYLGYPLEETLARIDISVEQFLDICDAFTNRALFRSDSAGRLLRRADGSPIRINEDNISP